MAPWTGKSRAMLVALLAAIAASLAPAGAGRAAASAGRTVSSVATIEWDEGGKRLRLESNRVDLLVEAASRPVSLAAYRFAATGGMSAAIAAPRCGNAPATLAAAWRTIPLAPARLAPAERIQAGEPLLLVLDHA
ncbi:MAG: hypothetical protein ACJ8EB_13185, partial [Allosphingosinicella sp.]